MRGSQSCIEKRGKREEASYSTEAERLVSACGRARGPGGVARVRLQGYLHHPARWVRRARRGERRRIGTQKKTHLAEVRRVLGVVESLGM